MACPHKFQQDLLLTNLSFQPTRLIVGTFNPSWPASNTAQWFYGRTKNNYFWDVVPQLQNQPSLINATPTQWKLFCSQEGIAISDLISDINTANPNNLQHIEWLSNYSDTNIATKFSSFSFVNIVGLLQSNPSIKRVYFTRSNSGAFWINLWNPVQAYCAANGIYCTTLLTPSGNARFQLGRHNKANPQQQFTLPQFIQSNWQPLW